MLRGHKKAPALTEALKLNTRVDAPSPQANIIITLSNNDSSFMRLKDIKTGLDNQLVIVYIDFTTANSVVRFEPLLYNANGVQRTIEHCAFFVPMILWWRCTCCLLASVCAYRTGFNLCNVTALIAIEPVLSGDPFKSNGDRKMSIPTNQKHKQAYHQYCKLLVNISLSHATDQQAIELKVFLENKLIKTRGDINHYCNGLLTSKLSNLNVKDTIELKEYLETFANVVLIQSKSQSLKERLIKIVQGFYLPKSLRKLIKSDTKGGEL